MYDYAHPICDYMQGVTHSLCTLEFEDHRPLYDWVGVNLGFSPKPRQIEFARLAVTNTVMSKRYLKKLVEEGYVHGWGRSSHADDRGPEKPRRSAPKPCSISARRSGS